MGSQILLHIYGSIFDEREFPARAERDMFSFLPLLWNQRDLGLCPRVWVGISYIFLKSLRFFRNMREGSGK